MEYVYAALLLHSAKQAISEDSVKKVLASSGAEADAAKVKSMVASLGGVDIEEAIKQAAVVAVAPAAGGAAAKKEEKKDEVSDEKKEEEAAAGLANLFG